jgi:hypothetical protein
MILSVIRFLKERAAGIFLCYLEDNNKILKLTARADFKKIIYVQIIRLKLLICRKGNESWKESAGMPAILI